MLDANLITYIKKFLLDYKYRKACIKNKRHFARKWIKITLQKILKYYDEFCCSKI